MFTIYKKEFQWGDKTVVLETGKIARQADGAVLASMGQTTVLCTAVAAKTAKPGQDFFPLTVNYQEKAYAAGKIPGGFFKREARPSESEILICRLIDRPIRPLFAPSFKNETQVSCTVMSHDLENQADIPSIIGTSAALTLSGLPFMGPIAGARVGYIEGEYILNPTDEELENSDLDLVVAGTRDAVLMVESEANGLTEEDIYKDKRGFVIITRTGIDKIVSKQKITVAYEVISMDIEKGYCVLKAVASMNVNGEARNMMSFGESADNNLMGGGKKIPCSYGREKSYE